MRHRIVIATLIFLVLITGCKIGNKISTQNLVSLYDSGSVSMKGIQSLAYNRDKDFSRIYLRIMPEALIAMQPADSNEQSMLKYQVLPSYTSAEIIDSGSIVVDFIDFTQALILEKDVKAPAGNNYVVMLQSSNQRVFHVLGIERQHLFGQQDFLLLDSLGLPLFSSNLSQGQPFRILLGAAMIEHLQVRFYKRSFPVALPPYSFEKDFVFDYKADSVFMVEMEEGMTPLLRIDNPGFYHFVADTSRRSGKTIYSFDGGFPSIANANQMLDPLRYLTTIKEYEALATAADVKLAVDRFWLSITGNSDRARARIRSFYNRVEQANVLFTSYHEGWKTDRGLVYIIYGPPGLVYRTDDTEKWIYGDAQSPRSLKFVFSKIENPFTREDYSLNKSPVYKESWFNAVEVWRR